MRNTLIIPLLFLLSFSANAQYVFKEYDINVGTGDSYPLNVRAFGNKVVFTANDGVHGVEPWISDGSDTGTHILIDLNPGALSSIGSGDVQFTEYNGRVYFGLSDGNTGTELWSSDGTATGTTLVADINAGAGSSNPQWFTVMNGKLYFQANNGIAGDELWVTDGTSTGTTMLKDIVAGAGNGNPRYLFALGSQLLFIATTPTEGAEPWVSDGTPSGTKMLKDIYPGNSGSVGTPGQNAFYLFNGKAFFTANEGTLGSELWVTDGTTTGTQLFKDLSNTNFGSQPETYTVCDNKLFFAARSEPSNFAMGDIELWVSDGTPSGTNLVKNIGPGGRSGYPKAMVAYNNKLYFHADDSAHGYELWESDGTAPGTKFVKDINTPSLGGTSWPKIVFAGKMFFPQFTKTGTYPNQDCMIVSDGTDTGTIAITAPGNTNTYSIFTNALFPLVKAGDYLFFRAKFMNSTGYELWSIKDTSTVTPPPPPPPPTTGVATVSSEHGFTISPNPAKDKFTVSLSANYKNVTISVRDVTGKEIVKQSVTGKTSTIDMKGVAAGTYFVVLKHSTGKETRQLVIE